MKILELMARIGEDLCIENVLNVRFFRTQIGSIKRLPYQTSSPRRDRPPINPTRPVLAQKILQASREAENALADALVSFIPPNSELLSHTDFLFTVA